MNGGRRANNRRQLRHLLRHLPQPARQAARCKGLCTPLYPPATQAGWARPVLRRPIDAVEQPNRRPLGLGVARTLGLGATTAGPAAARFRRISAQGPGPAALPVAGQLRRRRRRFGRGGAAGAVGSVRFLPRRARRARGGAALRQVRARGAAGVELPPALSDRDRADAAGAACEQDRRRHPRRRGPQHLAARVAGGKLDADRRREHRRRRILGAVAGQPEQSRRLSFQRPEPGGHRQGGGRELHAGSDRALECPAAAHRGAAGGGGGAGADAEDARFLQRRYFDPERPVAEGQSAVRGHRFVP